jgi:hypothetical protein
MKAHVEAGTPRDWLATVGHELQHGISKMEPKFSSGSNTEEGAARLIAQNPNWERDSGKRSEALVEYLRNRGEAEARMVEKRIRERGDWSKYPLKDYDWENMRLGTNEWDKLW